MTIAHTKDHLRTLSRETTVFDLSSRALNSKPHDRETPHMPAEITMPQLSDTMSEGTLVKWHKKEGDKIKAGEEIADVETDKAVMPMEAFDSGTLAAVLVKEGQKAPVGAVLAAIATGSEKVEDVAKKYASGASGGSTSAGPRPAALREGAPPPP